MCSVECYVNPKGVRSDSAWRGWNVGAERKSKQIKDYGLEERLSEFLVLSFGLDTSSVMVIGWKKHEWDYPEGSESW